MFSLARSRLAVGFALFTFHSSAATIEEYMPIFMAQLKYNALYIGSVHLLGLIMQLIGIPFAGHLLDKFQTRKRMLFICIALTIPIILLFLAPNILCELTPPTKDSVSIFCEILPIRNSSIDDKTTKCKTLATYDDNASDVNPQSWSPDIGLKLFFIMFFLRGVHELLKRISHSLITIATLTDTQNDKGRLRYYACCGELGAGISLFIVGVLASSLLHSVCGVDVSSYSAVFIYAAAIQCFASLAIPWMKFDYLEKRIVYYANVKSVLYDPHYILIMAICAHSGLCTAFQVRWEFWYMKQLGGSPLVMAVGGLTRRLIIGLWLILSRPVIEKLGELYVIAISLLIFAASFAALAFTHNAWFVIVIDSFQAASFVLSHASFVIHFSKASSTASSSFFQGKPFIAISPLLLSYFVHLHNTIYFNQRARTHRGCVNNI